MPPVSGGTGSSAGTPEPAVEQVRHQTITSSARRTLLSRRTKGEHLFLCEHACGRRGCREGPAAGQGSVDGGIADAERVGEPACARTAGTCWSRRPSAAPRRTRRGGGRAARGPACPSSRPSRRRPRTRRPCRRPRPRRGPRRPSHQSHRRPFTPCRLHGHLYRALQRRSPVPEPILTPRAAGASDPPSTVPLRTAELHVDWRAEPHGTPPKPSALAPRRPWAITGRCPAQPVTPPSSGRRGWSVG